MPRPRYRTEAAAWRVVAALVADSPTYAWFLCHRVEWLFDQCRIGEPLALRMQRRIARHIYTEVQGWWPSTSDSVRTCGVSTRGFRDTNPEDYDEQRAVRVLACEFLALEAAAEAEERRA